MLQRRISKGKLEVFVLMSCVYVCVAIFTHPHSRCKGDGEEGEIEGVYVCVYVEDALDAFSFIE